MCDFVVSLASGLMGHSQQQAQASYAERQAAATERQTAWEVSRAYESDASAMGDLLAQQAAGGAALEGSKADYLLYAGFGQALERDRLRLRGAQQASGLRADAAFRRSAAAASLTGSLLQAGSSLLKAAEPYTGDSFGNRFLHG
jgi:hypothetical protein